MTGVEPRPRWGEGALFEDQGCELGCPGNADIPNGTKTLQVESNSGVNGGMKRTEQPIDDVLALLKRLARKRR